MKYQCEKMAILIRGPLTSCCLVHLFMRILVHAKYFIFDSYVARVVRRGESVDLEMVSGETLARETL